VFGEGGSTSKQIWRPTRPTGVWKGLWISGPSSNTLFLISAFLFESFMETHSLSRAVGPFFKSMSNR
jgi:hypothetical protein